MRMMLLSALALVLGLSLGLPSVTLAAEPATFSASGVITNMAAVTVGPAGASGRWLVERSIDGVIFGPGNFSGEFTTNLKGNIALMTQSGNVHGTIQVGEYLLEVNGVVQPLEIVWFAPWQTYLPKSSLTGYWTFLKGAKGQGEVEAWAIFIPTTEEDPEGPGHVKMIVASDFVLVGQWQP